jgi:predicted  nucleic acid-binding Zn-ribbon protein
MSSSPKYSRARLRAAVERLLRENRTRQAALARARRRDEEQRRKVERLENTRSRAHGDVFALQKEVADLAAGDSGSWVQQELQSLQQRLQDLKAAIDGADSTSTVQRLVRRLKSLKSELSQTHARGMDASRAEGLAELEAARVVLHQFLAALDRALSNRFDPQGLAEVERMLKEADTALSREALAKSRDLLHRVGTSLAEHQRNVRERYDRWASERDQCSVALNTAADLLAGLRVDDVVSRWAANEVRALETRVEHLQKLFDAGQFDKVRDVSGEIQQQGEQIVSLAQESQLHEDRRDYIVRGIVKVMEQMGFVVQSGSPSLEVPGSPSSATIIQAKRLGGGAIAVSVPQEGDIWYDVGGFPMRTETGSNGQPVPTCDEAEAQIEQMHSVMEQTFGIEMGELQWQGKNPARKRKQADALPDTRGASRRRGGGA